MSVAIIVDGPSESAERDRAIFAKELETLLADEYELSLRSGPETTGDFSAKGARELLGRTLADRSVDLVITLGTIASNEAAHWPKPRVPIIAAAIIDPALQGIPQVEGKSGRERFTYVVAPNTVRRDLETLRDLVGAKRIVGLLTEGLLSAIPEVKTRKSELQEAIGVTLDLIEVGADLEAALTAIPEGVDAVYVAAVERLDPSDRAELYARLTKRGLPSYSMLGRAEVERGALAAIAAGLDLPRVARRVALDAQRILQGESTTDINVIVRRRERLVINMSTARALEVYPSWGVLTEAELLGIAQDEAEANMSLPKAVQRALAENLDLLANAQSLEASERDIGIARAGILPQLGVSASGTWIDDDRAAASFGSTSERQIGVRLSGSQTLYNESAYANLEVRKLLQASLTYQRETLALDVAQEAAVAYLDVLRARAFERIQRENLDVTRNNLELAEVRRSIGVAGPSEVYRWKSEIASDRGEVIDASARRNAAEINLNRILNRDLEAKVAPESVSLDNPLALLGTDERANYLDNPWTFRQYRVFMAEEGVRRAPELAAIDQALGALERSRVAATRSFWLPSFGLQGQLDQILARDGAGSEPVMANPAFMIPQVDDTAWSISVVASLPLFAGAERFARLSQAELDLARQRTERAAVAQRVEQRVRTAIHVSGASYANISLSKAAAEAAELNLEVVEDGYARGATGYLNLLDAQNAALVARQLAANAVYDFLVDQMNVERAVARFSFLESPSERKAWTQRLLDHLEAAEADRGAQP